MRGAATLLRAALGVALFLVAPRAFADKVVVLPFTAASQSLSVKKPELDEARGWAREAVKLRGHTSPSDAEVGLAERAAADGVADTSQEYRAAGRAVGAAWSLGAHVERVDVPARTLPDGSSEEGYSVYRLELEACQVETGRVESLIRDVDGDDAPAQIAEMLTLLLRKEGVANAELPWTKTPHARKAKPKVAPKPPEPPPEPPKPAPPPKPVKPETPPKAYAEGHPIALGLSVGISNALVRPDQARGPSWAMPIGGAVGYALEALPGLELRGVFTSQVLGPRAIEIAGGARYAFPVQPKLRVFVGPELLAGVHVALGADKTARFLGHGALFAAIAVTDQVQLEVAGDLAGAFGGTGTLVLGGATARALVRF